MARHALGLTWDLQDDKIFLNHGSFGLAPCELLNWRFDLLRLIERDPVAFLVDQLPEQLMRSRELLATIVGASSDQLAFVPSTTYGLNELFQSSGSFLCDLPVGSEILMCDHSYNATFNLVRHIADQRGWSLRCVSLRLPLEDSSQVVDAFAAAWTPKTRLLLVDHITSPTALVFPLQELIALARERDAFVIIDGAHGPGSVPLQLEGLQPDAYVGNLHKWLCCPRGAAFLWVSHPWQQTLRPLIISHGANAPAQPGISRFHQEHDWIGTADPTPWLALPEVVRLLASDDPHNFSALILRHHVLAQQAQDILLQVLDSSRLAPAPMQASMVSLQLPDAVVPNGLLLQQKLFQRGFQVPIIPLQPHQQFAHQFLRISCYAYNTISDIKSLASVLPVVLLESLS